MTHAWLDKVIMPFYNIKGYNSVGYVLSMILKNYQFESYKPKCR